MTKEQLEKDGRKLLDKVHCQQCGTEYSPKELYVVAYVDNDRLGATVKFCCPVEDCKGSLWNTIYPVIVTDGGGRIV